jgi:hypothetical protein
VHYKITIAQHQLTSKRKWQGGEDPVTMMKEMKKMKTQTRIEVTGGNSSGVKNDNEERMITQ